MTDIAAYNSKNPEVALTPKSYFLGRVLILEL
jgi:hypothetical protein